MPCVNGRRSPLPHKLYSQPVGKSLRFPLWLQQFSQNPQTRVEVSNPGLEAAVCHYAHGPLGISDLCPPWYFWDLDQCSRYLCTEDSQNTLCKILQIHAPTFATSPITISSASRPQLCSNSFWQAIWVARLAPDSTPSSKFGHGKRLLVDSRECGRECNTSLFPANLSLPQLKMEEDSEWHWLRAWKAQNPAYTVTGAGAPKYSPTFTPTLW